MKNKKKFVLSVFIFLLISCLGFVMLGPFISLHGIKKGIDEDNPILLERYVDFPELRKNVKARARQQLMNSLGFDLSESDNLLAKFAVQFADQMIEVGVDAAVSPQGISLMMSGNDLNDVMLYSKIENADKNKSKDFMKVLKESEFSFINSGKFEFKFTNEKEQDLNKSNQSTTTLVFYRDGFLWKLGDVVFAEEIAAVNQ